MKLLEPNYSCLQNPWLGSYRPPRSPFSLSSVLNWICWTPPNKIPGYATAVCKCIKILTPEISILHSNQNILQCSICCIYLLTLLNRRRIMFLHFGGVEKYAPIPMTAPGIAVSNPAGGMDVSDLWMLCIVWSLHRTDQSSRRVLPSVVCLSVVSKPQQWGGT